MLREIIRDMLGISDKDRQAHNIKNQMTRDIVTIEQEVRALNERIKRTDSYRIAKAAGRVK